MDSPDLRAQAPRSPDRRDFLVATAGAAAAAALAGAHPSFRTASAATAASQEKKMPFTLPELPYAENALEPFIDQKTMNIHRTKHHQAYVDNLNKAVDGTPWAAMSIEEICRKAKDAPDAVKAAFGHIFATTNPFDLPVLARIAWEQARNRVDFFDRPIVPRAQVDLRPGEQVGPYTSWLATSLGKAFPETISPRRVDHLLRGVGGGTAGDALSAIEQMAGLKAGALRSEPSETPVVGRALRRGGQFSAVNRQLADLYDLHYYWQARARNKELAPELAAYARYVDDQIQMVKFGQRVAEQTEDLKARQSLYRDLTRQAESMLTDAKRLKRLPAQQ